MHALYEKIAEILELDEVVESDRVDGLENWDSLSVFSILAHINTEYDVTISTEEMERIITVGDLVHMVAQKTGKT